MSLKLVNKKSSPLETTSVNKRNSIRAQVARSKGTEWMVSSYSAWQQRSPLGTIPTRTNSSVLRLVNRFSPRELQVRKTVELSLKIVGAIIALLILGKVR
jgi:hypothetical protein